MLFLCVSMPVLFYILFCFGLFSFFYLKTGGKFKTFGGIIHLPLSGCAHGKFELRLHNVNLYCYNVYFVGLDTNSYHMYCSLCHDKTDNSD